MVMFKRGLFCQKCEELTCSGKKKPSILANGPHEMAGCDFQPYELLQL